jgi:flagellar basal-body rod modification protein FlgD
MTSVENAEILNNYINTTSAKAAEAATATKNESLWGNFDTFLNILTTQLQNQDPTAPVDASEFTNQLVQYAEVEQQISSNDKLDSILSTLSANGITPLLSYVGQYIETASTNKLVVQNGTAMMSYNLDDAAKSVTVSVQDTKGDVIGTIEGTTTKGLNRIAWDGKLSDGTAAPDGVYKFVLTAKDSNNETMDVSDIRIIGQVSGIETDDEGNVNLKIGSFDVDDNDILSVFAAVGTDSSQTNEETET